MLKKAVDTFYTAFLDVIFLLLVGIFFLLMLLMLIVTVDPKHDIAKNAEYLITTDWQDVIDCDVDIWIESPSGSKISFKSRDVALMALERDDRGLEGDEFFVNGEVRQNLKNEEVVVFRGLVPGDYVVNVHLFRCIGSDFSDKLQKQVPVKLEMIDVNPKYNIIYQTTVTFNQVWEEKTAFRFSLDEEGNFTYQGDDFKKLIDMRDLASRQENPTAPVWPTLPGTPVGPGIGGE